MKRIEVPTEPQVREGNSRFGFKHREPGDLPLIAPLVNAKRGSLAVSYQWVRQAKPLNKPA